MSNVPIPDANGNARKVDTFARTDGADLVETQAVAVVDPATGTPIDFATQTTAAALLVAANAIRAAAEALNAKAAVINTGDVSGVVAVSNMVAPGLTEAQLRANPVTVDGAVTVPGVATQATLAALNTKIPASPASDTALAALNTDLGARADAAASTDAGTFSLIALVKRLFSRLPILGSTIPYDNAPGLPVRAIGQDVWTSSFSSVGASVLASEFNTPIVGAGVGYSQATGNLLITTGTTVNAEFLARSVASWQGALRLRASAVLSQRIVNNNFAVLLADLIGEALTVTINSATSITVAQASHPFVASSVGQFVLVGGILGANGVPGRYAIASVVPDVSYTLTVAGWPASGSCTATVFGHSYLRNLFTGTTATNVNFDTQRRGWAAGDTVANINTTASPGTIISAELTGREAYLSDQLRASTATPTVTTRASRLENLPDNNLSLYVFLWSFNGTTAPASTTTWTTSFLSVEKFANHPVYIQGARANGAVNPIPVQPQGTTSVNGTITANQGTMVALPAGINAIGDAGIQYRANATGAALGAHIISAATTNAAIIKASAGRVVGWSLANTNAAWRYVKLHNLATLPTAGASVSRTIAIPPNGSREVTFEGGIAFTTGIGITTVTGSADSDTAAVGLGDIVGDIYFA